MGNITLMHHAIERAIENSQLIKVTPLTRRLLARELYHSIKDYAFIDDVITCLSVSLRWLRDDTPDLAKLQMKQMLARLEHAKGYYEQSAPFRRAA